jgi:hypothetical protein
VASVGSLVVFADCIVKSEDRIVGSETHIVSAIASGLSGFVMAWLLVWCGPGGRSRKGCDGRLGGFLADSWKLEGGAKAQPEPS